MGLIADATAKLRNVLGDLFPEEAPSAIPLFPITPSSPIAEPTITIKKSRETPNYPQTEFVGFPTRHPYVNNPDGSQSNVKLGTWEIDGKTYAIPTMVDGKQLSNEDALKVAKSHGFSNYPSFKSQNEAEKWIQKYHGAIGEDGKIKNPESKPLGKITSYNYKNEELPDTNSLAMRGAWDNKLTNQGLAVSPDIEKAFREKGIKPKDKVEIVLADGTKLVRNWEDRTMQDKQAIKAFGKPLRGRFDLHVPDYKGPHEKDNVPVVGFRKVE